MSIKQKELYWSAFSNGVVPEGIQSGWMTGREDAYESLVFLFERAKKQQISGFKLIEGDYGSGKSMMLSVIEQTALEEGFVVARLSLGSHNNFSKPEVIYREIMTKLRISSTKTVTEFEAIFETWLKDTKRKYSGTDASKTIYSVIKELQNYDMTFSSVLLSYIRGLINGDLELSNLSAGWIKGDYHIPYEQKKKLNIKGDISRNNAFDILKAFSKLLQLLEYKGLVILVDELEYILRERVDIRNKSYTNIRHFIDEIGENKWCNTIFVGAHTPDMMKDREKGYQSYEALYQRITSHFDDHGKVNTYKHSTVVPIKPLLDQDLIELGKRVLDLKNLLIDSEHLSKLALIEMKKNEKQQQRPLSTRDYLKILMHLCELAESEPSMPIFNINVRK